MRRQSVLPNVLAYDALISACDKVKQHELAVEAVEALQRQGVMPEIPTYTVLLQGVASICHIEAGFALLAHAPELRCALVDPLCRLPLWYLVWWPSFDTIRTRRGFDQ